MNRIEACFSAIKKNKKKALIPFLTAGDPSPSITAALMHKLVDAGSVGIAGNQTGIYPLSSPGGWNLIGKTPKTIFNTKNPENSYLKMGDQIRFVSIAEEEFQKVSS